MSDHEQDSSPPQPSEPPAWQPTGPSGPRASFGKRLAAALLDALVIVAGFLVVYLIWLASPDVGAVLYVVGLVGAFAYFIVLEGGPRGQTLGKRAVGIRVVHQSTGAPIGYGRATGRLFARYLSQLPCYLGYLWMLWDKEKQTWHDKLTSSLVVPVEYYPVG